MDKIAVVILNWNGCEMLRSFLPSVIRCSETDGAVVYVADNGSTDTSVETLRKEFPTVHLIICLLYTSQSNIKIELLYHEIIV